MKTVQYQCEICHDDGGPLKSSYKIDGMSYNVLCPDHLIKFGRAQHQVPSTKLFGWPEYFFNYNFELYSFYLDSFRKWFV
jgi:hypothetical protein